MAADALKIASYNIHKCVGIDGRFNPARIARVIAELDADILAIQEADRRFGDRAGLLDLDEIARRTGLHAVSRLGEDAGHGWRGNLLLVRGGDARALRRIALGGVEPRGAIIADLAFGHGAVRVVATHLGLLRSARRYQVAQIYAALGAASDRLPVVMLGDLNEWRRTALHGRAGSFGPEPRGLPSFPARFPLLPLDRILARPRRVLNAFAVHDTPLARRASDHLPVTARLHLNGGTHMEKMRGDAAPDRPSRTPAMVQGDFLE